jgi:hypothetical protein
MCHQLMVTFVEAAGAAGPQADSAKAAMTITLNKTKILRDISSSL